MDICRLHPEEAAVRRFLTELWLPYMRELESLVDAFGLAEDVDILAEELPFKLDRLESDGYRTWIAVDGHGDGDSLAETTGEFAGFIAAERDECPIVFDRPDRIFICDIYVTDSYRGSELAETLFERTSAWARAEGCTELELDPHVENDRAMGFYEKLGFETAQQTMRTTVE